MPVQGRKRQAMSAFEAVSRLSRRLDRWVSRLTLAFASLALPLLIAIPVFNVVSRQVGGVGSDLLYEIESGLFFAMLMLSFGYTYLRDGHVRIDLVREKLSARRIAQIELLGCLAILIPLSALLIADGARAAWVAFVQGERLADTDLPYQWVLKATVPLGFLLVLLSSVDVAIRNALFLFGKGDGPAPGSEEGAVAGSPVPERWPEGRAK